MFVVARKYDILLLLQLFAQANGDKVRLLSAIAFCVYTKMAVAAAAAYLCILRALKRPYNFIRYFGSARIYQAL